jgi:sugar lactone lactonase YvrE
MVWILDRKDGKVVGSFGGNGRYAGQPHWIDAVAIDSKGNVYTGEVEDGKRIQKFLLTNGGRK